MMSRRIDFRGTIIQEFTNSMSLLPKKKAEWKKHTTPLANLTVSNGGTKENAPCASIWIRLLLKLLQSVANPFHLYEEDADGKRISKDSAEALIFDECDSTAIFRAKEVLEETFLESKCYCDYAANALIKEFLVKHKNQGQMEGVS